MPQVGVLEEIAEHLADIAETLRKLLDLAEDSNSEVDDVE
mgnify:FL=1|tara:strand:- start:54 stop:173 length:120 start_codon:yes stop_codon:yes gene_type:complete